MAVRVVPLASGSSGNATLVEFGRTRILVDAGISALGLVRRLEALGVEPSSIAAILLAHEHHLDGAGLALLLLLLLLRIDLGHLLGEVVPIRRRQHLGRGVVLGVLFVRHRTSIIPEEEELA